MNSARSRILVAVAVLLALAMSWTAPAGAHGGEGSDAAADLVRQAIAVIVNEPGNTAAAEDKLADAQASSDQSGVDAPLLGQARDALAAGDLHQARNLAELAIGAQPHLANAEPPAIREITPASPGEMPAGQPATAMSMANGAEPGVATYEDPLASATGLSGRDSIVLALSIVVGAAGVLLSIRFRPRRGEARS